MAGYPEDTIAAMATASGPAAIAILRLSGREAFEIAATMLRGRHDESPPSFGASHRARRAVLRSPEDGTPIDDVLFLPMHGDRSPTGENIVEIHCHGGTLLSQRALAAALAAGARAARPGEFTERAFLNGRLDLCQAEAVADLAQATSEAGLKAAWQLLEGNLSRKVTAQRDALLDTRALLEAHLDFPDEDIPPETGAELTLALETVAGELSQLAESFSRGRLARDGVRLALVGKPNVGKSSLMNALLGRDRALVSEVAGTTRDYLEEPLALGNLQALLSDTAGLREATDPLERAGVARSQSQIDAADLLLLVTDGSRPLTDDDRMLMDRLSDRKCLVVRNKCDQPLLWEREALGAGRMVTVSATQDQGLDELCRTALEMLSWTAEEASEEILVTRERHRAALREATKAVRAGSLLLSAKGGLDLVACELQTATAALDGLVGLSSPEDVLDRIFAKFCIGK